MKGRFAMFFVVGILALGAQDVKKQNCSARLRLDPSKSPIYLEHVRDIDPNTYLIAFRNNFTDAVSVRTPCKEGTRIPCEPEPSPPTIKPGESAEFAVPRKYLRKDSAIVLPFEYEWESFDGPKHFLTLNGPNQLSSIPGRP